MKKELKFVCFCNLTGINKKIEAYFKGYQFKLKSESGENLFFTYGNEVFNLIAFNPLKWNSQIVVMVKRNEIYVYAAITSFPHRVTRKKELVWDLFLSNLKTHLTKED